MNPKSSSKFCHLFQVSLSLPSLFLNLIIILYFLSAFKWFLVTFQGGGKQTATDNDARSCSSHSDSSHIQQNNGASGCNQYTVYCVTTFYQDFGHVRFSLALSFVFSKTCSNVLLFPSSDHKIILASIRLKSLLDSDILVHEDKEVAELLQMVTNASKPEKGFVFWKAFMIR